MPQINIGAINGTPISGTSLPVTMVSGEDTATTTGAVADAAVAAGAAGTISAKLRAISRDLIANIVLAAGENHLGEVGGKTAMITPTITVSTTPAYSAGDSIGGKITLTGALRVSGGTGVLQSLTLLGRSNQKFAGTLQIYNADPAAATLTDNAALVNSTDDLKIIANIPVAASDWVTINSKAFASLRNLGAVLKAASGTSLYASFTLTTTPTFTATTDVQMIFGILQD